MHHAAGLPILWYCQTLDEQFGPSPSVYLPDDYPYLIGVSPTFMAAWYDLACQQEDYWAPMVKICGSWDRRLSAQVTISYH